MHADNAVRDLPSFLENSIVAFPLYSIASCTPNLLRNRLQSHQGPKCLKERLRPRHAHCTPTPHKSFKAFVALLYEDCITTWNQFDEYTEHMRTNLLRESPTRVGSRVWHQRTTRLCSAEMRLELSISPCIYACMVRRTYRCLQARIRSTL